MAFILGRGVVGALLGGGGGVAGIGRVLAPVTKSVGGIFSGLTSAIGGIFGGVKRAGSAVVSGVSGAFSFMTSPMFMIMGLAVVGGGVYLALRR